MDSWGYFVILSHQEQFKKKKERKMYYNQT